jgi:hypothetical protein
MALAMAVAAVVGLIGLRAGLQEEPGTDGSVPGTDAAAPVDEGEAAPAAP